MINLDLTKFTSQRAKSRKGRPGYIAKKNLICRAEYPRPRLPGKKATSAEIADAQLFEPITVETKAFDEFISQIPEANGKAIAAFYCKYGPLFATEPGAWIDRLDRVIGAATTIRDELEAVTSRQGKLALLKLPDALPSSESHQEESLFTLEGRVLGANVALENPRLRVRIGVSPDGKIISILEPLSLFDWFKCVALQRICEALDHEKSPSHYKRIIGRCAAPGCDKPLRQAKTGPRNKRFCGRACEQRARRASRKAASVGA